MNAMATLRAAKIILEGMKFKDIRRELLKYVTRLKILTDLAIMVTSTLSRHKLYRCIYYVYADITFLSVPLPTIL